MSKKTLFYIALIGLAVGLLAGYLWLKQTRQEQEQEQEEEETEYQEVNESETEEKAGSDKPAAGTDQG